MEKRYITYFNNTASGGFPGMTSINSFSNQGTNNVIASVIINAPIPNKNSSRYLRTYGKNVFKIFNLNSHFYFLNLFSAILNYMEKILMFLLRFKKPLAQHLIIIY